MIHLLSKTFSATARARLALFLLLPFLAQGLLASPEDLLHVQRGTIPVVISAPHGGNLPIPDGELSEEGTTVRDMHTEEIALEIARVLEERLGGKPHYTVARFSRRFVDANRGPGLRPHEAYSGPVSQKVHEAYHRSLRGQVDEVREKFGHGLFIDLHGQSARPGQIIRGTVQGETVTAMLEKHGLEALIGPNSVFGQLHGMGYEVEPPVENVPESPRDETLFAGGYINRAYGSHQPDGIDAIQIELGRDFRQADVRAKTAADLAEAIAVYIETYVQPAAAPVAGAR